MRHIRTASLALAFALPVAGCSLQPMYSGGSNAAVAQGIAAIDVPPIPGRGGWLLRNALQERFGIAGETTPAYRLDVRVDDALEALGVLNDDTISRERRILRTRYQLIDLATGEILLDATAGSDAGIDVVSSEYATIAAEQTALENLTKEVAERMAIQVALTLRERSQTQPSEGS